VFETVLVANRGEIARRIVRTVQRMGLRAVGVV
jgi:acetyl/propionyl-CoA carboxylase alpha subunit